MGTWAILFIKLFLSQSLILAVGGDGDITHFLLLHRASIVCKNKSYQSVLQTFIYFSSIFPLNYFLFFSCTSLLPIRGTSRFSIYKILLVIQIFRYGFFIIRLLGPPTSVCGGGCIPITKHPPIIFPSFLSTQKSTNNHHNSVEVPLKLLIVVFFTLWPFLITK